MQENGDFFAILSLEDPRNRQVLGEKMTRMKCGANG